MSDAPPVQVLLVEDDPRDYDLIERHLSRMDGMRVSVERAPTYDAGLEAIQRCRHDVFLIDYRLGPRDGIDLVREAKQAGCRAPVIVLTGFGSPNVDEQALRAGADDYLIKDSVDAALLGRAIRYAMERRRLIQELEQERQRRQQEQELRSLEQLAGPGAMSVTAGALGLAPVRESLPGTFGELVQRFNHLLDLAMEERAFKVDHKTRDQLRSLAEQFGVVRASPADVVDVCRTALGEKMRNQPVPRSQAYLEEGRVMTLGLMGDLASYYRSYCFFRAKENAGE